jgi:hypothetical protein
MTCPDCDRRARDEARAFHLVKPLIIVILLLAAGIAWEVFR